MSCSMPSWRAAAPVREACWLGLPAAVQASHGIFLDRADPVIHHLSVCTGVVAKVGQESRGHMRWTEAWSVFLGLALTR